MTLEELKKEIIALGYQETIDSSDLLIFSVNRALRDLYSKREILRTVRLFATGQRPSTYYKEIHCVNGEEITLPLIGRAFSMRICGEGTYRINDGPKINIIQFSTGYESKQVRGFIEHGGTIQFYGNTSFMVLDFSVYDEVYTNVMHYVPDGASTVTFNIRELFGDFMSFISPATDGYGNIIEGGRLYDGQLEVPATYRGEIQLTYRTLPPIVTDDDGAEIAVPEEYSHLFPLLTASYIWLDADADKAQYYKALYEEMLTLSERGSYRKLDFNYGKGNGWA